jgi:hypothetical protein
VQRSTGWRRSWKPWGEGLTAAAAQGNAWTPLVMNGRFDPMGSTKAGHPPLSSCLSRASSCLTRASRASSSCDSAATSSCSSAALAAAASASSWPMCCLNPTADASVASRRRTKRGTRGGRGMASPLAAADASSPPSSCSKDTAAKRAWLPPETRSQRAAVASAAVDTAALNDRRTWAHGVRVVSNFG